MARRLHWDLRFRYMAGDLRPDFRTINGFRVRHREEFAEVFRQTVHVARRSGLAKLGRVAIDGSKLRANTSRHKAMSHARMEEAEERLEEEIAQILAQMDECNEAEDEEHGDDDVAGGLPAELRDRERRKGSSSLASTSTSSSRHGDDRVSSVALRSPWAYRRSTCCDGRSMKSIGLRFLLVAAVVLPAALEAAQDAGSQVKELLEVTGLAESVRSMPAMAGQQGASIGGDDELGKSFQQGFVSSFAPEPILARTESELVAHYDAAHAASILTWYASPLGQHVRAASEAVNTVAGQAELGAYAEGLQADPPTQQRVGLVAQLDAASDSTGQLTEMVVQMSRSFTASMARVMAPDDPAAGGVADQELAAMRQQLGPLMRNQILVTLLFTLRNFTDEEVAAYLAFSGSAPYQWFNRHSFDGFLAGISAASVRFAESFAPTVTAAIDVEARDRLLAEARAYGEGREDRECLGESLKRDAACTGFGCHVQNAGFLGACLETSAKRSDVCAGAPPLEDLQRTILWRLQQCASIGREDPFCRSLMGSLQKHCAESRGTVGT